MLITGSGLLFEFCAIHAPLLHELEGMLHEQAVLAKQVGQIIVSG
jgi:hypothetical protein